MQIVVEKNRKATQADGASAGQDVAVDLRSMFTILDLFVVQIASLASLR